MRALIVAATAACAAAGSAAAQQSAGVSIPLSADVTPACTLSTPTAKAPFQNVGLTGGGSVVVDVGLQCMAGTSYTVDAKSSQLYGGSRALTVTNATGGLVPLTYQLYWGRTQQDRLVPVGQTITDISDGTNAPKPLLAVLGQTNVPGAYTGTVTLTISY